MLTSLYDQSRRSYEELKAAAASVTGPLSICTPNLFMLTALVYITNSASSGEPLRLAGIWFSGEVIRIMEPRFLAHFYLCASLVHARNGLDQVGTYQVLR